MVEQLQQRGFSQRGACRVVTLSRSVCRSMGQDNRDDAVIAELQGLAERFPERGFGKYYQIIGRRHHGNHKRIDRVYCALGLDRRRMGKNRLPSRTSAPLAVPVQINHSWSIDFMRDTLWSGRRLRTFNIVDDFSREILAVEVDKLADLPVS